MRKITAIFLALVGVMMFVACSKNETYADQVDAERKAIDSYIKNKGIKVISETEFIAAGEITDTTKNEYVLFESSGVYMQIMRKGIGAKIKNGENATVLCRYTEWNLLNNPDTVQTGNTYARNPDKMYVSNTSGTFKGTFDTNSTMYLVYGKTSGTAVPSGWLTPLTYILIGRPVNIDDEIAKVRLIVPHDRGQGHASQSVYPCLYEITYERG